MGCCWRCLAGLRGCDPASADSGHAFPGFAPMIPVWLPVVVPWAGAALLAALPRRPVLAGPAVALASLVAAVAVAAWGGTARPGALGAALLLAGATAALLFVVWDAAAEAFETPNRRDARLAAAGFPLLQGAQAMALLAGDAGAACLGLAVGAGAGVAMVALPGERRAFAAAWRMLLLCGAGSALALLGVVVLRGVAAEGPPGLANLGFVLLLLGFGAFAGLAPLGGWLPRVAAVAPPPVVALVAGLLPPAALHALLRAAEAVGPGAGALPPGALLVSVGLATAGLAAVGAWRSSSRPAVKGLPGRGGAGLVGLAAVGFGIGGAAGALAGALLLLGLPFCVGAAALGARVGGSVAALGHLSLAGMPPFAPFAALVSLFSAVASLPAATALPLGAALLTVAAVQLVAAGRIGGGAGSISPSIVPGRGAPRLAGPAWVLLALALVLGAALPEAVATALAGALAEVAR